MLILLTTMKMMTEEILIRDNQMMIMTMTVSAVSLLAAVLDLVKSLERKVGVG